VAPDRFGPFMCFFPALNRTTLSIATVSAQTNYLALTELIKTENCEFSLLNFRVWLILGVN
jgi:hypothetical protein